MAEPKLPALRQPRPTFRMMTHPKARVVRDLVPAFDRSSLTPTVDLHRRSFLNPSDC
jgi:hypothetical protein